MMQLNLPDWLIRINHSFLKERDFEVHIGDAKSGRHSIPFGVPQGSVLSPTLYNVFVHDIPSPQHSKIVLFADDTVIFLAGRFMKRLVRRLTKFSKTIYRFLQKMEN